MKKLLAIFLAVTMIATFIPSAFAVEGEEETYDGVKMTYDIEKILNAKTNADSFSSVISYMTSNGLFKYAKSSIDSPASGKIEYAGLADQRFLKVKGALYVCFEIVIPETDTYKMNMHHQQSKSNAAGVNVYITPADTFYNMTFSIDNLGEKTGFYECYNENAIATDFNGSNKDWTETTVFENVELPAGKYVVTFFPPDRVSAEKYCIGNITLSSGTNPEVITNGGKFIDYDVQTVMADNSIYYVSASQDAVAEAKKMDYNMTNGFFEVSNAKGTITVGGSAATTYHYFKLAENATIEFKVNVPEEDTYFLRTNYQVAGSSYGTTVAVLVDGEKKGEYNCSSSRVTNNFTGGATGTWINNEIVTDAGVLLSAGEHTIAFTVPSDGTSAVKYGTICSFELITGKLGTLTTDMGGFVKIDDTTLAVDEAANILGAVVCSSDGSVKEQSDANTTYESSDKSVVKVEDDGTTITAVGAGTADITTTVGGVTAKRTITVLNKEVSGNVSLGVYSDVDGYVTVTVDEVASNVKVDSVAVGSWVKATAKTDDPDYIFRGWKRGSRDNGVWISESPEISFPIMTNTFLTAVYEPVAETEETVDVEFFNYNGQYLDTKEDVGDKEFSAFKPEPPSLTGYSNPFWTLDGVNAVADDTTFQKLTRVVANYRNKDSFDITIGDGITAKISGTDTIAVSGEYEYDTVLILSSEKEGSWYIDGKLVAYGNAYALNVWNDAEITFDEKENNVPIIALDGETKANGARMISYDANGKNIAEVGIIFGEDAEITSFESKATAKKRGNSQGQFTAMPYDGDGKNARGYLIYNDNGTYRVIYAD
ncbi:MAG: hypothetical protein IJN09_01675 [Oscillospiraceae bacterium]|nr:hypothetical protein [Oscillospiraceae bacterium]